MALLIPRRMRLPAVVVATSAWGIAVVVGVLVAGQRHADPIDRTLIDQVHAAVGNGAGLAVFLLVPTDTDVIGAAMALLAGVALCRRRWDIALLAVATPVACVAITELALKPLFARRLYGLFSYPSGHAVASIAVYTVAILAFASAASKLRRCFAIVGWIVLVAVVITGLVGMNCHYPTDAVGGVCVAVGVVLPCAILTDALHRRRRSAPEIPQPRSGADDYNPHPADYSLSE
ncbi:MAG TPA: phosphatase PAP2 family protein [Pseudonocardiaceae bacterium]